MTKEQSDGVIRVDESKDFVAEWALFQQEFADYLEARDFPLYAIPLGMLDAIEQRLSGWIKPTEIEFERTFASLCDRFHGVGVVPGKAIKYTFLASVAPLEIPPGIPEALGWDKVCKLGGATPLEYAKFWLSTAEQRGDQLDEQRIAYAGWLMTEPAFLEEIESLKAKNPATLGPTASDEEHLKARGDFAQFCDRWQLTGMATWDLPLSQGPNFTSLPFPDSVVSDKQVSQQLQLPATMRLPARFPVRELLGEMRRDSSPEHLAEWQKILDQKEGGAKHGLQGYRQMMPLHFYRHIVLPSRYRDRIKGHVEGLDVAFGKFLGDVSGDSIKRLRLACNRRLKP